MSPWLFAALQFHRFDVRLVLQRFLPRTITGSTDPNVRLPYGRSSSVCWLVLVSQEYRVSNVAQVSQLLYLFRLRESHGGHRRCDPTACPQQLLLSNMIIVVIRSPLRQCHQVSEGRRAELDYDSCYDNQPVTGLQQR